MGDRLCSEMNSGRDKAMIKIDEPLEQRIFGGRLHFYQPAKREKENAKGKKVGLTNGIPQIDHYDVIFSAATRGKGRVLVNNLCGFQLWKRNYETM